MLFAWFYPAPRANAECFTEVEVQRLPTQRSTLYLHIHAWCHFSISVKGHTSWRRRARGCIMESKAGPTRVVRQPRPRLSRYVSTLTSGRNMASSLIESRCKCLSTLLSLTKLQLSATLRRRLGTWPQPYRTSAPFCSLHLLRASLKHLFLNSQKLSVRLFHEKYISA
jgi:hypothetical protein